MLGFSGKNLAIESIKFIGAISMDSSASAIRYMGGGFLYVKNCSITLCHNAIFGIPQSP